MIAMLLLLTVSSCGIFDTREPDPPLTGSGFIWVDATSYEQLLANFEGSIQSLDAENYKRVFVSSSDSLLSGGTIRYSFFHNPSLDPSSRVIFANWDVESERNYLARLKSVLINTARLSLDLKNVNTTQSSTTQVTVNTDYTLAIPSESTDVVPNTVTGFMRLQLLLVKTERGTQEWRIANWYDDDPTGGKAYSWTDLKASFSN